MMTVSFNPKTGEYSGSTTITKDGYAAHEVRKSLKLEGEESLLKRYKKNHSEWEVKNFRVENKDNIREPLKVMVDFSLIDSNPTATNYFNPMFSSRFLNNPFTEEKRIYPVDLIVASDELFMVTIKIPQDYVIEETPKPVSVSLDNNLGKFSYSVAVADNTIKITSRIILNEFYFAPGEYESLKGFYDLIVQKHSEQIILKKRL